MEGKGVNKSEDKGKRVHTGLYIPLYLRGLLLPYCTPYSTLPLINPLTLLYP